MTRRALLASALTSGCALPWQQSDRRAPIITPPVQTAVRFGPTRLRLVLAREGHDTLDAAVRTALTNAARDLNYTLDLFDIAAFLPAGATTNTSDIARQLLVAVQAGVPPSGLLLLGRQAQTVRLQEMGLLQEVSGLMRSARARWGQAPEVGERTHVVAGNWFAAPLYQRLIGHWVRPERFAEVGLDPETATATFPDLRAAVARLGGRWGVGPDDTPEADAWCWSVIHAWGGALTERGGDRVTLASAQTGAALEWLAGTFREARPVPSDERPAAFAAGDVAYLYTEGAPPPRGVLVTGPGGPAGPGARPKMVGGGAVWLLPRGAAPDPAERLWEALFQPAVQRELWRAGAGFALPFFEGHWSDTAVAQLPSQESVRRFRALLAPGGFISDTGQLGKPTAASQAVEAGRLAVRMVRAVLAGQPVPDALAAGQADAEAIYKEHAFPEG